jgi:hypothetical protein
MPKSSAHHAVSEGRPFQPGAVALFYALVLVLLLMALATPCRTWPPERLAFLFLGGLAAVLPGWHLVERGLQDDRHGQQTCVAFAKVLLFFLTLFAAGGFIFSTLRTFVYF